MTHRKRLAVLVAVLAAMAVVAPSAQANTITDTATCRHSPDPQTPDGGMNGIMAVTSTEPPPEDADPFAPDSPWTVYDAYGFGGLQWPVYDQGCVGNATSTPMNLAANMLMTGPVFITALSQQVSLQMRHPDFLGVFDPLINNTTAGVRTGFFARLLPLTLMAVAIGVLMAVRGGSIVGALRIVGWMAVVMVGAILFLSQPLAMVHWMDDGLSTTTGAIDESFGDNASQIGQVHRQILYTTWAAGMFGDADSPTAKKYGPDLFKAGAYSWREIEYIRAHPDQAQAKKDEKQQQWADIADAIAHEDPIAYEHLQGAHADNRLWHALFAMLGVVGATVFTLLAGFAVLFAFLAIRLFVLAWPVTAILAMVPGQRLHVLKLWSYLSGAVISAVALLFISRLVALFVGSILGTAGLAGWLVVFLILVTFFAAWKLTRAQRSFTGGHASGFARRWGGRILAYEGLKYATESGVEAAERQRATRPEPSAPPMPQGPRPTPTYTATATTREGNTGWVAPEPRPARGVASGAPVPNYRTSGLNPGPKPEPAAPQYGDVIDMEPTVEDGREVYRPMRRPPSKRQTTDPV